MQLFLSGADQLGQPQSSIDKSLGNFISSIPVRNNIQNNLFGNITYVDVLNQFTETKAVFLKNVLPQNATNIVFYYDSLPDAKFQIALISVNKLVGQMEKITSTFDTPIFANFEDFNVTYANGLMTILNPTTGVETLSILSQTLTSPSGINGNLEGLTDFIVSSFSSNSTYLATKVAYNQIQFTYKTIGVFTNTIHLTSSGTAFSDSTVFSGGVDNRLGYSTPMVQGDLLGIWFKRTLLISGQKTSQQLYDEYKLARDPNAPDVYIAPTPDINSMNLHIQYDLV